MADSTTPLDLIQQSQTQKEVTANALYDALSPATLYGRRGSTTTGLSWGYYGGNFKSSPTGRQTIVNGVVALTASATNYLEADATTGAVSKNTTGFTSTGKIPLYKIVTAASAVSSYEDWRPSLTAIMSGGGAPATLPINLATDVAGDLPYANLTQGAALSVLGVAGNATADVASIVAGADGMVLRRSGTTLAFGAIDLSGTSVTGSLPAGKIAPAGADTQVQFNDAGVLGASAQFLYDKTTNSVALGSGGFADVARFQVNGSFRASVGTIGVDLALSVPAAATSYALAYASGLSVPASAAVGAVTHLYIGGTTLGSGASIASHTGVDVADLVAGTSATYAFRSQVSAGTGKWGVYADGTAPNYFAGQVGIGAAPDARSQLGLAGSYPQSAGACFPVLLSGTVASPSSGFVGVLNLVSVAPAVALGFYRGFQVGGPTLGSGASYSDYIGFMANEAAATSRTLGFNGVISAGANKWNCFMDGNAANYFEGDVGVGVSSNAASAKLQVDSTAKGFLPPRMTATQRDAIASPAVGLQLFNTTADRMEQYTSGQGWIAGGTNRGGTTVVATTSGASVVLSTTIPATARAIVLVFNGVTHSTAVAMALQIGAGSFTTTGYASDASAGAAAAIGTISSTTGFALNTGTEAVNGSLLLLHAGSNVWIASHTVGRGGSANTAFGGGRVALGGALDRIQITAASGAFSAGSISFWVES